MPLKSAPVVITRVHLLSFIHNLLLNFIHNKNITTATNIKHHVNNMTLVRCMRAYNSGEEISPAKLAGPDMDIQIQIQEKIEQL